MFCTQCSQATCLCLFEVKKLFCIENTVDKWDELLSFLNIYIFTYYYIVYNILLTTWCRYLGNAHSRKNYVCTAKDNFQRSNCCLWNFESQTRSKHSVNLLWSIIYSVSSNCWLTLTFVLFDLVVYGWADVHFYLDFIK